MAIAQTDESPPQKPLRLWPGVFILVLQWLAWVGVPIVVANTVWYLSLAALAGTVAQRFQRSPSIQ